MDRHALPPFRDERMTFTGSNVGQSRGAYPVLDAARVGVRKGSRIAGSDLHLPKQGRFSDQVTARGAEAARTATRTAEWLCRQQADDGHWRGPLEGDTILESEYLLILAWAGRLTGPNVSAAARRILSEQLPEGGWAIYPGGPVDVSASVKAYLALKLTGHDRAIPALAKARRAIQAAGGPWAVNSFTKFYLALLGQLPYAACPAVPPEMVLLPDWFPVNLHRVSAWSRTMIVPLSLMWAFKPVRNLPVNRGIAELFEAAPLYQQPSEGGWAMFFRGVDHVMKACESLGFMPLRARAVQACRRWMLDRFDGSEGLGAIFPPIVWSIVALRAIGCDDESPEVQECWRHLEALVEREPDGSVRVEPCRSPVWDTAITVIGLVEEASLSGRPVGSPLLEAAGRGIDWLLANEIHRVGDWTKSASMPDRVTPSGWCFQYANRFYPDIDDTAMVIVALSTWLRMPDTPGSVEQRARVTGAIQRGLGWLEAMQGSDGGWAAFDRDNTMEFLCKVPFADHNAMIDPSTPDIAGRALEAMGKSGVRRGHPAVDHGIDYLRRTQEPSGAWFGRWGVNYIYGTWQALEGLRAVGVPLDDPMVLRAARWFEDHQQPDGGWGESPESYADPALAGLGPTTASQTAWAIAGLVAAGHSDSPTVERGLAWLVERQAADGTWAQQEFTGTGFPQVFYLRYHFYPIYFPLVAICRALTAWRSGGNL
jgi:squalene-hopene/tetraprenyl-beta-curcumene cyclase